MEGSLNCGHCILNKQCGDIPSEAYYEYDGERLRVCPRVVITDKSIFLINIFRHYRNGHLYKERGISNQPSWYLRGMVLIEGAMNKNYVIEQKRKERRTI